MLIKKGERFNIIVLSRMKTKKEDTVRLEYAFSVPNRDLSRENYNRLKDCILEDFPGADDQEFWTGANDFCPAYSFDVTYQEYQGMLNKYQLEDVFNPQN